MHAGPESNVNLTVRGELHNLGSGILNMVGDVTPSRDSNALYGGVLRNDGVLNLTARLNVLQQSEMLNQAGGKIALQGHAAFFLSPGSTLVNDGEITASGNDQSALRSPVILSMAGGSARNGSRGGSRPVVNNGKITASGGFGVVSAEHGSVKRQFINRGTIDFTATDHMTRALNVAPYGDYNDLINDRGGVITVRGNNAVAMNSHGGYSHLINRGTINLGEPGTTDTGMVAMQLSLQGYRMEPSGEWGGVPASLSAVIVNDYGGRINIHAKDSYAFNIEEGASPHKTGYLLNRGQVDVACGDMGRCGFFKTEHTRLHDLSGRVQDSQFSYALPATLPQPQSQVQVRLPVGKARLHTNTGILRGITLEAKGNVHNTASGAVVLEGEDRSWYHAMLRNDGTLNVATRLTGSEGSDLINSKGGLMQFYGDGVMVLSPGASFRNDGTIVAHELADTNSERHLLTLHNVQQGNDRTSEIINGGKLIARDGYGVLSVRSARPELLRTFINRGRIEFTAGNGRTRALHIEQFGNHNTLVNDVGGEITVRGNHAVAMSSHAEYSRLINRGVINLGDPGTNDTGMVAMELGRWGEGAPDQRPRTALLVNDHAGVINIHAKNSSAFRIENDSRDLGYLLNFGKVRSLCGDNSCRKFHNPYSTARERTLSPEGRAFSYAVPLVVAEGSSHVHDGTSLNALLRAKGLLVNNADATLTLVGEESSRFSSGLHNRGRLEVSATALLAESNGNLVNFENGDIRFSGAGHMKMVFNSKFMNYGKITAESFNPEQGQREMVNMVTAGPSDKGERIHRNLGTLIARGGYSVLGLGAAGKNARRSFINHGTIDFTAEGGVRRALRIESYGEYNDIVNDVGGSITVRGNGAVAMSSHGENSRLVNRGTINLGEPGTQDTGMVALEIGAWAARHRPGQPDPATRTSVLLNDDSGVINIHAKNSHAFLIADDTRTRAYLLNRGRVERLCGNSSCSHFKDTHTSSLDRTAWQVQGLEYDYVPPPLQALPDPTQPPASLIVPARQNYTHTGTRSVMLAAEGDVTNSAGATLSLAGPEPSYFLSQLHNHGTLAATLPLRGIGNAALTNFEGATFNLSGKGRIELSFRSEFSNRGTVLAERPEAGAIEPVMLSLDLGVRENDPDMQLANHGKLVARDGYRVLAARGSMGRRSFLNYGSIDFTAARGTTRALQIGSFGDNNTLINAAGGEITVRGNGAVAMSSHGENTRLINRGTINLGEAGTTDTGMIAMELGQRGPSANGEPGRPARKAAIVNDHTGIINIHARNSHAFSIAGGNGDAIGFLVNRGKVHAQCGDESCGTFGDESTRAQDRTGQNEERLLGGGDALSSASLRGYVAMTRPDGRIGTLDGDALNLDEVRVDTSFTLGSAATRMDFARLARAGYIEGVDGIRSMTDAWRAVGWRDASGDVGVTMIKNDYRDLVDDASLRRVAGALQQGYDAGALFRSLELMHRKDIAQAIRQLSGAGIQQALRPVQVLERRFARLADDAAVDLGSGFGFNLLSRGQRGTQLGASSYDMVALQQRFDIAGHGQVAVRYGIARVKPDGTDDTGLSGSSQLLSVSHQQPLSASGGKDGPLLESEFRYALHQVSTRRTVRYGQDELQVPEQERVVVDARPRADQRRDHFTGQVLRVARPWVSASGWALTPLAGLKLHHSRDAALNERDGGIAALKIAARRETALEGVVGLRLDHDGRQSGRGWLAGFEVKGRPTLYRRAGTRDAQFTAAPGQRFALEEGPRGRFSYDSRLSLSHHGRGTRFTLGAYLSRDDGLPDRGVMANWLRQF
ncbi:hypothetical protein DFO50_105194 [Microvirgula sp. AG722]|nr:hypothetical protein DFO50_105194 [Microvirgula sp. AG722]